MIDTSWERDKSSIFAQKILFEGLPKLQMTIYIYIKQYVSHITNKILKSTLIYIFKNHQIGNIKITYKLLYSNI